ncbi:MAG: BON domain-containing protein [Polyangiaceae bacterium]|jgi:osmotically-inducible protein OsmY
MKADVELQRHIADELAFEPSVNASAVRVSAQEGVVTLTGHVRSYAEKFGAELAARRIYGVKAVSNELRVKLPGSERRGDEDLARAAVRSLATNMLVPANRIKLHARDGWILLEGDVDWQYQKDAAERAVQYLPGVVGVRNTVAVKPSAAPTEIKDKIEEALRRRAESDARRVDVEVSGGEVVLRGTVRSWAERREAERAAWAAPGVYRVEDLIQVSP